MAKTRWGKWLRAAAIVFTAACIALLAKNLDWARVVESARRANPALIALAAALALASLVLQAARWWHVIQPVRPVPFKTVLAASLAGQAASCVLPLRAGEAVRLELLSRASRMTRAAALGTVATDHTVNGSVMFLLAAAAPLFLPVPFTARVAIWGAIAALGILLYVLLKLAAPGNGAPKGRVGRAVARLREGLLALRNPRAVAGAAASSAAAWILEVAAAAAALSAFGLTHGAAGGAAVIFGVNVAMAAPAPPANLGTFELGAAMALMALGEPSDSAAAFALGYHAMLLLPMVLLGGIGLIRLRKHAAVFEPETA